MGNGSKYDSDVVVVGAGPGGSSAATYLARAGHKVILIDRSSFPRDKVCGDLVSPLALKELRSLGVTSLPEYKQTNKINRAALYIDGLEHINKTIPYIDGLPFPYIKGLPAFGRVIPRKKLDYWIFNAASDAGAHTLEDCKVTSFENQADGVELTVEGPSGTQTLFTKLLIGADGCNSVIARLLRGYSSIANNRIFSVRAYFEGINGPSDQVDLYVSSDHLPGLYWLFPSGRNAANVGVAIRLDTVPPTRDSLRDILLKVIKEDAGLSSRLSNATMVGKIGGSPLTTYHPRQQIIGERVMLIGDAAGLVNPLSGEGMQYALLSGRWASDAALSCIAMNNFSREALSSYSSRVEGELRYDRAFSNLIFQAMRNRSVNPILLHTLKVMIACAKVDPDYAHIAGGIWGGLVPAKNALSLKIIGKTLYQGVISLVLNITNNILCIFTEPGKLADAGRKIIKGGYKIIYDLIRYPADYFKWTMELLSSVIELVSEIAKDIFKSVRKKLVSPIWRKYIIGSE